MHNPITREQWLEAAIKKFEPLFNSAGHSQLPPIKVSVGWPVRGGLSRKRLTIGECWSEEASLDGKTFNIFISPLLDKPDDTMGVLATLLHEVVHAVVGTKAAHGPAFTKLARLVGLEGKPTSTHAGEALTEQLVSIARDLGEFPHTRIDPKKSGKKKQTTRLIKCECRECGYTIRITQKWLGVGVPACPATNHGELHVVLPDQPAEGDE